MIVYSTTDGYGYNPFLLSVTPAGKRICLVSMATDQQTSVVINIVLSVLVVVLSLSVLTTALSIHPQVMMTILLLLVARIVHVVYGRTRDNKLICSQVQAADFRFSVFTVEWTMVAASLFFLISAIRLGTYPMLVEGFLFTASSVILMLTLIPCFQASLIRMRSLS